MKIIIMTKQENQDSLTIKEQTGGFKEKTKYFVSTIYKNFLQLSKEPKLNHTPTEINRLLKSTKLYALLVYDTKKRILAYMVGEIIELQTGKIVFFINYIYVVSHYRNLGIASKLMNMVSTKVEDWGVDGMMLVCDTENQKLHDFYLKRGFMPDQTLRRYTRHEVLSWYR